MSVETLSGLTAWQIAGRIGLAIGMAIFMGLAFEGIYKREQRDSPGGIRTFPALALLGAVLYALQPSSLLAFVIGLASVSAWLYAYLQSSDAHGAARPGLMVPVANLLAYAFAPLALNTPAWVVVGVAVLTVLLLEGRGFLHHLVDQVPQDEVITLGKFLILAGIVLPLLPNHAVVAWTPITPFKVWLAVVAVSGISYASYLLQRYAPTSEGPWLPAVLGGIYSSTATTVALARAQRRVPDPQRAAGIVIANSVMYLRVVAIVGVFNAALALRLLPALLALAAIGGGLSVWLYRHSQGPSAGAAGTRRGVALARASERSTPADTNPLQVGTALTFALSFVVIALASTWAQARLGQGGVLLLSAIAGVSDINPLVMTLAQGGVANMTLSALAATLLIAVGSNNLMQAAYAVVLGGVRACAPPALALSLLGALSLAAAASYWAH